MNLTYVVDKGGRIGERGGLFLLVFVFLVSIFLFSIISAAPQGPNSITQIANGTKGNTTALVLNISGGYITTIVINATTQNVRWKAILGNVTGKLTLDNSAGNTIYDWSLSTVTGEVYATRNSTTPQWTNIKCANNSLLETENTNMNHTNADDNISKTFNYTGGGTHAAFTVGSVAIGANTCPTLNTYIQNASQDTDFDEMALTDSTNFTAGGTIIYATVLEQDRTGYDNSTHDFQMLIPENGAATWTLSTAYYIYAELT